jgi:hypothetical protein
MRSKFHYAVIALLLIAVIAAVVFGLSLDRDQGLDQDQDLTAVDSTSGADSGAIGDLQLIEQPWITFVAPKKTQLTGFELSMTVLQPLSTIQVSWSHPATGTEDQYQLSKYRQGNQTARYIVRSDLGNFLPGKNDYTIRAVHPSPGIPDQVFNIVFSVVWDITSLDEVEPDVIKVPDFPTDTDLNELELLGRLSKPAASVQITSWHPKNGQASFRLLSKFRPGDQEFQYFAKGSNENFFSGNNFYLIEAFGPDKKLLSRKKVTVMSSLMTLDDQLDEWFGNFKPLQDGWFVSTKLPWFSIRPVYDTLLFQQTRNDSNILLPRPALIYTSQASKDTPLCEYLKSLDYQSTGVSYVGNSYQTCQQYRYGVSVFDRFVSPLMYKPFDVVRRIDYQGLTDQVSSAFLMIETGNMKEQVEGILSFEQMADISEKAQSESEIVSKEGAASESKPIPRYYLYQFSITENIPRTEEELPDIAREISDEKKTLIEDIRAFLQKHPGDELFTSRLFPTTESDNDQGGDRVPSGVQKE